MKETEKRLSDADRGGSNVDDFAVDGMGDYVLLPGDPDRIKLMADQWENSEIYSLNRGFRAAVGTYSGVKISSLSTGMGGANLEFPLTSLAGRGVKTFIRVGTTGAIQENIAMGDIIINDASVRLDGTSRLYVRDEFPSAASFDVTMALVEACENLNYTYHVGTGCTTASFYAGQSRESFGGYKRSSAENEYKDLQSAGVLNYDMEGAALFTLARIFGLRAGMCASVIAQRVTGEFYDDGGEARACRAGAEAVKILTDWDEKKKKAGKRYYFPSLS